MVHTSKQATYTLTCLVRTPLNHIINCLELSLDFSLSETARGYIEASLTASKSLIYIINDLLDLSKLDDSNMLVLQEPFSLRDVMLEVVESYASEAERRGLAISFNIDSAFLVELVVGDSQRLRQAVSNILSNSLAHSDHGVIDVEIYPKKGKSSADPQDTLIISIRDQGRGMTEQQLDDLFIQLENLLDEDDEDDGDEATIKKPVPTASIGLGLAIVARYVRNSNGQMKVETMAGKGTTFSLQLPLRTTTASGDQPHPLPTLSYDLLAQDTSTTTTTQTDPIDSDRSLSTHFSDTSQTSISPTLGTFLSETVTAGSNASEDSCFPFPETDHIALRVLVAEDNPLNARVMKMQLKKLGHEVTVVGDGQACLDKFKSDTKHFDMILMDFQVNESCQCSISVADF